MFGIIAKKNREVEIIGGLKKIANTFFSRHFLMYIIIGSFNTLNTAIISHLLSKVIYDYPSSYLAFFIALSIGYVLNARINFHHRLMLSEYLKFLSIYIPHFIIYAAISTIALSIWNFPPFWATVTASVSGSPITYLVMRFFAFGTKRDEK